ncbi:MAG TPA: PPK2 family polyphosphate kinase [Acidimicrobiales bacterium]|nr:PPK2 family polyphosphate kinase [Acidimicrobiales bacterium]
MRAVDQWRVRPGETVRLDRRDPASVAGAPGDKTATEQATLPLHEELFGIQDRLWAESTHSVLVVLQGLDASGKDGTIKHVFRGVNPQGTNVASFKQPTPEEQAHDFLWRVHRRTPAAGEIAIFNRSHYEDVLVVRVHGLAPEKVWRARYDEINAFERLLARGGTTTVKFFLHVSFEEQGRRLRDRLERPDKRWKARAADFLERGHWDAYQRAYTEAIEKTSTDVAPWYVIPADHKWYRNWAVSQVLLATLEEMAPRYPDPAPPDLPDGVT